jgi:hypothetical protein
MKAKLKLDPNAVKQFFIDHMEKMIFGLVMVFFAYLVYEAVSRQTLKWGPEDLARDAKAAQDNVAATKANPPQYTSYLDIAKKIRKPIAETDYTVKTVWDPLKFEENVLRGTPKLFPVADLRTSAGDGAFAMAAPQDEEESTAATGPTRGQRWVVVTGLIQHRKQKEAYDATFQEAAQWDRDRDYPDYVFYRVERAEIDPRAATAEPKWTTVPGGVRGMLARQQYWTRVSPDVVDGAYLPPQRGSVAIAFPLGPLQDREWGPEVAHSPEIPALEAGERGRIMPGRRTTGAGAPKGGEGEAKGAAGDADASEEAAKPDEATKKAPAKKPRKKSADEPDEPDAFDAAGGASSGPAPGASRAARGRGPMAGGPMAGAVPGGGMPGMMAGGGTPGMMAGGPAPGARAGARTRRAAEPDEENVEEKELDYLLFRFFDFTVEPGKHYRYRVKIVLANPNHGMLSHYLEKDGLEKPQYLEADWSEPSPEVAVPLDSQALTVSAKPDGSAKMMLCRFNVDDGVIATKEMDVPRGQLLDYRQQAPVAGGGRAATDGADEPKIDYLTNSVLLDVVGGGRLPGKDRSLLEPASVLLLDAEGALVVRNEIDDLTEIDRRKQAESGRASGKVAGLGPMAGGAASASDAKKPKTSKKDPKKAGKAGAASGPPGMSGMTPGMMPGMPGAAGGGVNDLDDGPKRGKKKR